ncbi:MAG: oxalate/formate MFS antiporter [Alphaproteobacteria bacterium]|nr:oxalate/formate MFS antiporter [Alphaproteobacteria bacterium]MBV8409757.1 oxalate/formate MFS antiporter [Alphaproteobacteria bacterium]
MTLAAPTLAARASRWSQLWLGVACMVLIANLQYGWTLFVNPMSKTHGWSLSSIQVAFSIFIATETWLTPIQGWIVDKMGPRRGPPIMIGFGGLLVGVAWLINAYASTLAVLYVGAAISGTGAGAIYATCVGNAVKWFPDRRGLAVGMTAAGFGAGAALTVIPIRLMIEGLGYAGTFFWFGIGQGAVLLLIAPVMRGPLLDEMHATAPLKVQQSSHDSTPGEVLRSPIFWMLYVMLTGVSASGLIVTAQIAPIASDFGLSKQILIFGAAVLPVALVVDNIMNGLARPFFGWVSDHIGRENTMAIAFTLGGLSYLSLGHFGTHPWTFVLCAALIFFTWGEIFSLFPSTCTDHFGTKYATTNAMLLYTAKGTSALLVPLANLSKTSTGSWDAVFITAALVNFVVVLLALYVLKPARRRLMTA